MVNRQRHFRVVLAERVVGKLGEMDDGIEALEVGGGQLAHVLGHHHRAREAVLEQPATPVEARIHADSVMPASQQLRAQYRAYIAVRPRVEYAHTALLAANAANRALIVGGC